MVGATTALRALVETTVTVLSADLLPLADLWQEGPTPGLVVRRPGRPRDADLTARLMDAAVDIVADRGVSALSVDALMARTGGGRSGIYRRWRFLDDLVREIALSCELVPPAPTTGSLTGDLCALLQPFSRPLTRAERFIAAIWGAAQHDPRLWAAVQQQLLEPLTEAVADVVDQHAARGERVSTSGAGRLHTVVQGLWLQRYLVDWSPVPEESLETVVRELLVPVLHQPPAHVAV